MAIYKCKMCGGTIEFQPGETVGICDSCGTRQSLPRLDDDLRANLYDRAGHFRRNFEFDKAASIYEQLLRDDNTDAEAYWSLVLCRNGIEYIEDPLTHKRIPTVNRTQSVSVFDDENYRFALQYGEPQQQALYYEEAQTIDEIRKNNLEISGKEEHVDVFICCKETDAAGSPTPESVIAENLCNRLKDEGLKVFFKRTTPENKSGSVNEPYIHAALNSAKVMVVLGTCQENFNAARVKNEWARYLALIKSGSQKVLIPAYKDMGSYDLPDEFSRLKSLDMSQPGFMQELVRGIKEASERLEPERVMAVYNQAVKTVRTASYDQSVNQFQKAMAGYQEAAEAFRSISGFQNADMLAEKCLNYAETCKNDEVYLDARAKMTENAQISDLEAAVQQFQQIPGWRDSYTLMGSCMQRLNELKAWEEAEEARRIQEAEMRRIADEKAARVRRTLIGIGIALVMACIAFVIVLTTVILPQQKLNDAMALLDSGFYDEGYALLTEIGKKEKVTLHKYNRAVSLLDSGDYEEAYALLTEIGKEDMIAASKNDRAVSLLDSGDYDEAYVLLTEIGKEDEIISSKYERAVLQLHSGNYEEAAGLLQDPDYQDSRALLEICNFGLYLKGLKDIEAGESLIFGKYEQDDDEFNGKEDIEWVVLENDGTSLLLISKDALDAKPFSSEKGPVTWETSMLRTWLNDDFLNAAFSNEEQKVIKKTVVRAEQNPKYNIDPGNDTEDQVFLLSFNEAKQYFSSNTFRLSKPSTFAGSNGAGINDDGCTWWWLRTSGEDSGRSANVTTTGAVNSKGMNADNPKGAVRPVLWIDLNADIF